MAHLEKYTKTDYHKLLMHYERAKDKNGNYHRFKNQDIELKRTNKNYNLAAFQTLPQAEFMKKRLGQLKIFNRADVKYLCDWVITLPRKMINEEQRFFEEVFKFFVGKYKQENIVSAYIHKDESQPHMHFAFIPVAMDKKKNIEKLCSKEVVSHNDLCAFHEELDKYLTSVFGYSTGVHNEVTKDGNFSVKELKRIRAMKLLADETKTDWYKAQEESRQLRDEKIKLQGQIRELNKQLDIFYDIAEQYPDFWKLYLRLLEEMERTSKAEAYAEMQLERYGPEM